MIISIPMSMSKSKHWINDSYVKYISEAGLEPMLITPENDPTITASLGDGLLLPGGIDIDPTYYGENNLSSYGIAPEKDRFERALLYAFVTAGKPVFGICRGFQLIAREYLRANQKDETWLKYAQGISGHSLVQTLEIPRTSHSHKVSYSEKLYGEEGGTISTMFTNSMHHQGLVIIDDIVKDSEFEITAVAPATFNHENVRIVEAFRIKNNSIDIVAVQWHPEELKDYKLIQTFFGVETEAADFGVETKAADNDVFVTCGV